MESLSKWNLISSNRGFDFIGALYFPKLKNQIKQRKYKGQTTGVINSYNENKVPFQSFDGAPMRTFNYEIEYSYEVEGITYSKTIYLNRDLTNSYDLRRLSDGEKQLIVKYNNDNPNESTILLE